LLLKEAIDIQETEAYSRSRQSSEASSGKMCHDALREPTRWMGSSSIPVGPHVSRSGRDASGHFPSATPKPTSKPAKQPSHWRPLA
jgi:hypothetical protein